MKRYSQRRGVMYNHPSKRDIEKTRIKNERAEFMHEAKVQRRVRVEEEQRQFILILAGLFAAAGVLYNMWKYIGG